MALELSGERSSVASLHPVRAVLTWIAAQRKVRAQRLALAQLLEFDHYRLADLGINRADLFDALHSAPEPARLLDARRGVQTAEPNP